MLKSCRPGAGTHRPARGRGGRTSGTSAWRKGQDPGIDKAREDGVQIILDLVLVRDLPADPGQAQAVADALQEEIAALNAPFSPLGI